ncbi:hypothetical protein Brsp01_34650 [Brucella sp. NBRC 12950]|nr:hypothetical protein Brsp01_34650 [Brucella sp. NBRC 12950]
MPSQIHARENLDDSTGQCTIDKRAYYSNKIYPGGKLGFGEDQPNQLTAEDAAERASYRVPKETHIGCMDDFAKYQAAEKPT